MGKLKETPFTSKYFQKELEYFKLNKLEHGNVQVKYKNKNDIIRCYMYREHRSIKHFPVFYISGVLWMALTPMEVESHYMPAQLAEGKVGVAGLGMGYYVQKILEKENVEEVCVYELNKDVINFYLENFGEHDKLNIIKKDIREVEGEYFDFFYCDIYESLLDKNILDDMALITSKNNIKFYHFWSMEQVLMELIFSGYKDNIPERWRRVYLPFLEKLRENKEDKLELTGAGEDLYYDLSFLGLL